MRANIPGRARAAIGALLLLAGSPALAAEEAELDLFSVTRARGALIRTDENMSQFVGAAQGSVYVQTDEGPVRAGSVICSASIDIDTASRAQKGSGLCTFTSDEGGEVYGKWTCSGFFLIGCSGPFSISGASGRLKGAQGEGQINFRSAIATLGGKPGEMAGAVEFEALVFWRNLKIRTP